MSIIPKSQFFVTIMSNDTSNTIYPSKPINYVPPPGVQPPIPSDDPSLLHGSQIKNSFIMQLMLTGSWKVAVSEFSFKAYSKDYIDQVGLPVFLYLDCVDPSIIGSEYDTIVYRYALSSDDTTQRAVIKVQDPLAYYPVNTNVIKSIFAQFNIPNSTGSPILTDRADPTWIVLSFIKQ